MIILGDEGGSHTPVSFLTQDIFHPGGITKAARHRLNQNLKKTVAGIPQ
jgi:hypothetical protein